MKNIKDKVWDRVWVRVWDKKGRTLKLEMQSF